jgi:hypothetical protein
MVKAGTRRPAGRTRSAEVFSLKDFTPYMREVYLREIGFADASMK